MTKLVTLGAVVVALLLGLVAARGVLVRFIPIEHTGVIKRIERFNKGGIASKMEGTRQLVQFAIIFEDGFVCEGSDTALAAIKVGDKISLKAYHDVRGWPLLDPAWWECDEGQLVKLFE